jgi:hypothetical protein
MPLNLITPSPPGVSLESVTSGLNQLSAERQSPILDFSAQIGDPEARVLLATQLAEKAALPKAFSQLFGIVGKALKEGEKEERLPTPSARIQASRSAPQLTTVQDTLRGVPGVPTGPTKVPPGFESLIRFGG